MNALKFVIQDEDLAGTKIKVVGVGGGGSNAVTRMMTEGLPGVEFHIINTDAQALKSSPVPNKLAIGTKLTSGLGAGSDPVVGRQAALDDTEKIIEILEGADMVFVTAGLGGGTGTGAAPVVASLAKELNALTVAVVTKPFRFEGSRRMKQAERGMAELGATVDTVISVPNDKLLKIVPKGTSFFESFRVADDILRQAVQGISDIILTPGLINRDFSDIRASMLGMGYAMMGTATARGEKALLEAARQAINCPLMEEGGVRGARALLINITGSNQLSLEDVDEACMLVRTATEFEDVQINFGVVLNEALEDEVKITVIATGFERDSLPQIERRGDKPEKSAPPRQHVAPPVPAPVPPPPAPMIFPVPDPEPQPMAAEPVSMPEPEPAPVAPPPAPPLPMNDIDVPAFMRRERRLYQ